jgi:hypothetical protein
MPAVQRQRQQLPWLPASTWVLNYDLATNKDNHFTISLYLPLGHSNRFESRASISQHPNATIKQVRISTVGVV